MTVFHHTYLFRANDFRLAVQPIAATSRVGDYDDLRQQALNQATRPEVRAFLGALRADYGYEEGWSAVEPDVLFSMLLVEYATPYPLGQGFDDNGWATFHIAGSAAEFAGWARKDVQRIYNGRELCELLGEESLVRDEDSRPWCHSAAGWLSTEDIERYRSEMNLLQRRHDEIAETWRAKWPVWAGNRDLPQMIGDSLTRYCATYEAALLTGQQLLVFAVG